MIKRIAIFIFSMYCGASLLASPTYKELNSSWKFKQARLSNWYPASVPGTVQTDLMRNGIIEDPYFRLNERGIQWIDKEDWIYETQFALDEGVFEKNNIRLNFKGLDTYADVYLNNEKILSTDNMFREWTVNVKSVVNDSINTLKIYFHSPFKIDIPKWDANPIKYDASNDQSENGGVFNKKTSVYARKAGYHYGWDWGPRIVTSGIWRPIILEAWDDLKIENIFIHQKEVSSKKASITTYVEVLADKAMDNTSITIKDKGLNKVLGSRKVNLAKGLNKVDVDFSMNNPKLWWSNGLGEPYLYTFETEVSHNNSSDRDETRTGIRSIRLINKPDEHGQSLYFEINGIAVFAKGANYIPSDIFLPRLTYDDYKKEIMDAVDVNMNMLRVWGGGIYEDDMFYQLCDENGILVWQDFMFACSMYPADEAFLESVKHEAIDNIRRLRNHASLALWCGNNEITEAWFGWGWKEQHYQRNPEHAKIIWDQYMALFHKLLPDVVAEYAPNSYYRPSSPFSRVEGVSESHMGDSHYWRVWHGKEPISQYNVERSRFFSEYGFQSFPEFESIKIYAPNKEDWSITSEVMMAHQRGGDFANELINDYLTKNYKEPKDFESFLYANQVLQGDAIKTAIEAHRRDMPYCMGTLYWQHNDCWPVASWSSRDYYRRWKAQHYFAREAFRDILVSPIADKSSLKVFLVSDRLNDAKGTLTIKLMKMDGTEVKQLNRRVNALKNSSSIAYQEKLVSLLGDNKKEDIVIYTEFKDEQGNIYTNNYFLAQPKDIRFIKPTIDQKINPIKGGYELMLKSDHFVRATFLSIDGIDNFFDNNYFDILPGKEVTVKVKTDIPFDKFKQQLKIKYLNEY